MPDFMNPSADLQAGIAAGWAEGQRQIENMQDEIEHLEKELDEQRARAQRLEAALVLVEDQRDKALKERDDARAERATWKRECSDLAIKMKDLESDHRCDQIVSNVYRAQASQFAAQLREAKDSQDILLNGIVDAVAQRDKALYQNSELTRRIGELEAMAQALEERVDGKLADAIAERDAAQAELATTQQMLDLSKRNVQAWAHEYKAAIAERDALRKQLDELRSDYADKSYWGKE